MIEVAVSVAVVSPDASGAPWGCARTVYWSIELPPSSAGAVNDTSLPPSATDADTIDGAPGTPAGVTDTAALGALSPAALVATTVISYWVPLVRPVTVIGD